MHPTKISILLLAASLTACAAPTVQAVKTGPGGFASRGTMT